MTGMVHIHIYIEYIFQPGAGCQPISPPRMSFDMLRNSVLNSLLLFAKVIPAAVGSAFWVTDHGPFPLPISSPFCGYCFRRSWPSACQILWPVDHDRLFSNLSTIYFVTKAANDGF